MSLKPIMALFFMLIITSCFAQLEEKRADKLAGQLESVESFVSLKPDSAIIVLNDIRQEAKAQSDVLSQAKSFSLIGKAYLRKLELDSSKLNYKKAQEFIVKTESSNEFDEQLWEIQKGLADIYTRLYEEDSANHYLNELEQSPLLNLDEQERKANLIYLKCYLNYKMENYEECIQYGLKILELNRDTSNQNLIYELNTKMLLAKTFYDLEDVVSAQKYFEQCLEIETLNRLALRFTNAPKYSYAIFLMENADNDVLDGGDSIQQIHFREKAKQLMIELNASPNLTAYNTALYSNGMAEALFYDKMYDSAIVYHKRAFDYFSKNGFNLYSGVILLNMSLCHFENENLDAALSVGLKGKTIVEEEGNMYYKRFAYEVLYKVYEKQGDAAQALIYFRNHVEIDDSLRREEELLKISDLESKYELGQKEQELVFKDKELQLSEEVSQSKSRMIWAFGVGLFLVLMLSIFLFNSNREKKMINGYLVEKQDIIEENLKEKEALLREVHHRVKNNLQVISGMLQLQADKMDDSRVDQVMQEGQERIKSMAIIHQRFYEGEEIRDISFGEYLQELTEEISLTYGSEQLIQLNIEDNKERFNIDTSIPLGIIVNELISNAYKHAFSVKKQGEITIQLLQKAGGLCSLIIKDNGKGLPKNFNIEETQSMGLKLVRILIKQMHGELEYSNNEGAQFIITFPSNT